MKEIKVKSMWYVARSSETYECVMIQDKIVPYFRLSSKHSLFKRYTMNKNLLILLVVFCFVFPQLSFSQQAGTLDNNFGTNGYAYGSMNTDFFQFGDVEIQQDGKIVVMGRVKNGNDYDIGLLRLDADGSIDNSFGTNGEVNDADATYSDQPTAMALQQDQKILVASGTGSEGSVLRFNSDGSRDNTFGANGRATFSPAGSTYTDAWGVEIQTDQKIVVGGNSFFTTPYAVRLNADGSLDNTFGVNGIAQGVAGMTVFCMKLLPTGKIMIGGRTSTFSLIRFNSNGTIDSTFGVNGKVETSISTNLSWVQQIHLLSNGDFIASGSDYTSNLLIIHFTAVRYSADGIIDVSYGTNGIAEDSIPNKFIEVPTAAALQTDGKIVFCGETADAGSFTKYSLLRLNADGSLDATFGSSGYVVSDIGPTGFAYPTSIVIQPDNKIVVGGKINGATESYLGAARYNAGTVSGTNDFVISNAVAAFPNPAVDLITINYSLTGKETVRVYVTDLFGRVIKDVLSNDEQFAGEHIERVSLDGEISAGIYFICIVAGTTVKEIKVVKN